MGVDACFCRCAFAIFFPSLSVKFFGVALTPFRLRRVAANAQSDPLLRPLLIATALRQHERGNEPAFGFATLFASACDLF
jgi:hypothetical protein